jgi:hypothetical protein
MLFCFPKAQICSGSHNDYRGSFAEVKQPGHDVERLLSFAQGNATDLRSVGRVP